MKSLVLPFLALVSLSSTAFAVEPIRFTGKVTSASQRLLKKFPDLVGRECSIELTLATGDDKSELGNQYWARPSIRGLKKKADAPLKKMFLYHGTNHVYEAGGSKYRGEIAQILKVALDASETKVMSWTYVDGTEDWFETYRCE